MIIWLVKLASRYAILSLHICEHWVTHPLALRCRGLSILNYGGIEKKKKNSLTWNTNGHEILKEDVSQQIMFHLYHDTQLIKAFSNISAMVPLIHKHKCLWNKLYMCFTNTDENCFFFLILYLDILKYMYRSLNFS